MSDYNENTKTARPPFRATTSDWEKPNHEQVLRDAINTDAGVVTTAALVAYLESRREAARDACMLHARDERDADRDRGLHSLANEILRILKNPTRDTENP